MGTRCGDIDAFLIPYIMRETGKSLDEVVNILNKESGLLGVSGVSSDSRDIEDGIKAGNERCILAQNYLLIELLDILLNYGVNYKMLMLSVLLVASEKFYYD